MGFSGPESGFGTEILLHAAQFSTTIVVVIVNFRIGNAKHRFLGFAEIGAFEGASMLGLEMARHMSLGLVPVAWVAFATTALAEEAVAERNVAAFTPGTVISVGQDIVVGVISRGATSGDGMIRNVVLDLEAISPSLQTVMGGKSARVVINADCQSRRIATQSMQIFERPNATGTAKTKAVITDWTTAPAGSYGADVLDLYCKPAALAALTTPPNSVSDIDAKPAPAPSALAAKAAVKTPPRAAQQAPVRNDAGIKPGMLMTAVVSPATRGDAGGEHLRGFGVQLFSSLSSGEANATLQRLKSSYAFWPAGREGFVSQAEVNGASRFRARLGGFARLKDAKVFCEKVTAAGGQCIVVKDPS